MVSELSGKDKAKAWFKFLAGVGVPAILLWAVIIYSFFWFVKALAY